MNKKWLLISFLPGVILVLSACGGSAGGASTNLKVDMTDFTFTPNTFTCNYRRYNIPHVDYRRTDR